MFPPIFPVYIRALVPLYPYATLTWLAGVFCLWLTRYTHQLGKRWGRGYYVLSAVIRPVGLILISLGWLALYAPGNKWTTSMPVTGFIYGWLPNRSLIDVLCWLAVLGFFAFGVWSVAVLGVRRSFLFRHVDDHLVVRGPYALVRHPQFLASIGMMFFATRIFHPDLSRFMISGVPFQSVDLNWVFFSLSLWVLAVLEDRELTAHFGAEYEAYARRVPRIFPN
jgi:protein-S-isoprenylcysteine O-methyltransferase Ste14